MLKKFKKYKRKGFIEARPYIEKEDVNGISISDEDIKNGSPKEGDMIARNPNNYNDKWLVAKEVWINTYETEDMEE